MLLVRSDSRPLCLRVEDVGAGWRTWGRLRASLHLSAFHVGEFPDVRRTRAVLSLSFVQARWDSEDDVTMKQLSQRAGVCAQALNSIAVQNTLEALRC